MHLAADDPNSQILVAHEIGHAVMDDVYNDAFPAAPNCNPHSIQGASSAGCAWTEGWAEWFPATVYNDPFFRWANGASLDLENAGWGNGWSNGDTTEGRIAGSLIDLTDSNNEAPWDRVSEGRTPIWNRVHEQRVTGTLGQFWAQRGASGGNVGSTALATLFNNTVDYGFRDPMANYVQLSRPSPVTPHNFSYNTTSSYWSVVAVRPNAGSTVDHQLYDDSGMGSFLKGSSAAGTTMDFIAVDSNRRPLGDYYPRAFGTGGYLTELAQGSNQLPVGTQNLAMGSTDVVAVRDVFLPAGVKATLRVTPGNATQNPALFLMSSNAADSSTWIKSRAQSTKWAFSTGRRPGRGHHLHADRVGLVRARGAQQRGLGHLQAQAHPGRGRTRGGHSSQVTPPSPASELRRAGSPGAGSVHHRTDPAPGSLTERPPVVVRPRSTGSRGGPECCEPVPAAPRAWSAPSLSCPVAVAAAPTIPLRRRRTGRGPQRPRAADADAARHGPSPCRPPRAGLLDVRRRDRRPPSVGRLRPNRRAPR